MVGCLGLVSLASGMRGGGFREPVADQNGAPHQDSIRQEPHRGFFDSLRQGYARLKNRFTSGRDPIKAQKNEAPIGSQKVNQPVVVVGELDVAPQKLSEAEIKALAKSKVNFADRIRIALGLKQREKTVDFNELSNQIDKITADIADLEILKNKKSADINKRYEGSVMFPAMKAKIQRLIAEDTSHITEEIQRLQKVKDTISAKRSALFPKETQELADKIKENADKIEAQKLADKLEEANKLEAEANKLETQKKLLEEYEDKRINNQKNGIYENPIPEAYKTYNRITS